MATFPEQAPPWVGLRAGLRAYAQGLREQGRGDDAGALDALTDAWWREQEAWVRAAHDTLRLHHEINNALVGVSGNLQLLLMSPTGREPGLKDRLEVVLREAGRIEAAVKRLGELKTALGADSPAPGDRDDHPHVSAA